MSVACGAITARQAEPMGDDAPSGPDFAKEARAWFVQFAGTLPFTVPVCARSAFLPPLALFACFRFVDLAFVGLASSPARRRPLHPMTIIYPLGVVEGPAPPHRRS